ncbi:MAG: ABC transporter permease [Planctomycetota bacterium JB042]
MSNKTILVAQREYVENLRTKTFWVGIFFFPIIISLSIVIPIWLEKTKDVRKYAVVDHSGWLFAAAEKRAAMPDLQKVLEAVVGAIESENVEKLESFPEPLRELGRIVHDATRKALDESEEEVGEALQKEFLANWQKEGIQEIVVGLILPEDMREFAASHLSRDEMDRAMAQRDAVKAWYDELDPEDAREYGSTLSRGKYERIELDLEGDALISKLNEMVDKEELFAYFVIGEDPLAGKDGQDKYISNNLTDKDLINWLERHATAEVQMRRFEAENIDQALAKHIQKRVSFDMKKLSSTGEEEEVEKTEIVRQWAPVAFVYFLWMAVFSISQMLLTNTIEEKSNRILEVLLSSVSPLQLMSGKIVGIMWTGLTMILSWVLSTIVLVTFLPGLLGAKEGVINFASIARDPFLLTSFVVYFLLGYLFFAALLVGIGSVCNTVKEANNLMMPVTVMLMLPLFAMIPISKDPNGTLAKFLSYIPPFTPFVMMNRAAGPPTNFEYVATSVILILAIVFVFWAAAKIFRIGILMTGKPPSPMEMIRWLKAPIGQVPVREEE